MSEEARRFHRDAQIVDGCVFFGDGSVDGLTAAGVDAAIVTVSHFEADFEQATDQIAQWLDRARVPDSRWHLVRAAEDFAAARAAGRVGLVMGWQNMRPIADKLERLALFHALGVRVMQLTYNRRNFLGDGCLERDDGGLSDFGRACVARMNELGIAIDLSHVGERTAREAAEASRVPVLVTHANARAVVDVPRNKGDAVLDAVRATDGVVGATVYGTMCWSGDPGRPPSLDDFLRQLDYLVDRLGPGRVAIGTDFPAVADLETIRPITEMTLSRFPGAIADYVRAFGNDIRARYVREVADHAALWRITEALQKRGWSEPDLRGLWGENWVRVLGRIWSGTAGGGRESH
jgi:membrane dipeptidase